MIQQWRKLICALVILIGLLPGCKTTPKEPEVNTVNVGQTIPFAPTMSVSRLYQDGGAYPTLFSSDSYALWVGPELTAARRMDSLEAGEEIDPEADAIAPIINENFLVLECHFVSYFEDMSIGYDVVGLRGITAHLETPDGQIVYPAQSIMGTDLLEESNGALKIYRRTNLLVFPRSELNLMVPGQGASAGSTRLVLEGLDTRFFFEWFPRVPTVSPESNILRREPVQKAKMKFNDFYGRLKVWAHNFD